MENIILNYNLNDIYRILPYFSCEIFCFIGILVNLTVHTFFKRKQASGRFSNVITSGIFLINTLILSGIFIKSKFLSGNFDITLLDNQIQINDLNYTINLFINFFMFLFVITTYKITKKNTLRISLINACLMAIATISSLLMYFNNFLLTYIQLEILTILIYQYASFGIIRKYKAFSKEYILLSTAASVLFILLYILSFISTQNPVQTGIIKVCITLSILLKIGLFPIYNYQATKGYKDNIPYSILLFCFLPWIGVIIFNELSGYLISNDKVYQIPMLLFASFTMISFSLFTIKQKSIIKFCASLSYFINMFCIIYTIYVPNNDYYGIILATGFCFIMSAFWSTICILNENLESKKIKIKDYKGLFYNNRFYAAVVSFILLLITFIFPSYNSFCIVNMLKNIYVVNILKNIYTFDKMGMFLLFATLISICIILFKIFNIIRTIYTFDKTDIKEKFKSGTSYLYAAPLFIVVYLILKLFL